MNSSINFVKESIANIIDDIFILQIAAHANRIY